MGNSRIDQAQEFFFGFGTVIQNLLRNVNETDHLFFGVVSHSFNLALFDLEELEFRHILLINILHTRNAFNDETYVLKLLFHLGYVFFGKFLLECKDLGG